MKLNPYLRQACYDFYSYEENCYLWMNPINSTIKQTPLCQQEVSINNPLKSEPFSNVKEEDRIEIKLYSSIRRRCAHAILVSRLSRHCERENAELLPAAIADDRSILNANVAQHVGSSTATSNYASPDINHRKYETHWHGPTIDTLLLLPENSSSLLKNATQR